MATWCVDASATGAGSGLDWDNAFTSINACLENPLHAVDDTYLCRGTFVMSAYSGASPGNINFVGVNALGIEDGTDAVIDCNGLSGNIFYFVSGVQNRSKRFRNFKFQNWTETLFIGTSGYLGFLVFVRCKFTLGGYVCVQGGGTAYISAYYCEFTNIYTIAQGAAISIVSLFFCYGYGLTYITTLAVTVNLYSTMFHRCTYGVYAVGIGIFFSALDRITNRAAAIHSTGVLSIISSRITNSGYAGSSQAGGITIVNTYLGANTIDLSSTGPIFDLGDNSLAQLTDGYEDSENLNYNLSPDSVGRRDVTSYLGLPVGVTLHITKGIPCKDVIYPNIEQCVPSYGSTDGGVFVAYGLGFTGASGVYFGNTSGTITSFSDTVLSGVAPTLAGGRYDVFIHASGGIASASGAWTAVPTARSITSIEKSIGDVDGYMKVRLYSEQGLFLGASGVSFEGIPARSFEVIDAYYIDAVVPKLNPEFYRTEVE